ncbi:MAG: 6-phosphogluconolactonase [Verrucomicrobia bacterium]|nr:6-phosphogluconolactonase [Verrucomicrobiota bacterium]
MKHFELISFPSETDLADAVAQCWIEQASQNNGSNTYNVALSGGRITRHFYSSIAAQYRIQAFDLHRIHFFWSDERCVPPADRESNFATAQDCLFSQLPISAEQIHRIRGEAKPDAAVSEAETAVLKFCRADDRGWPAFDLVLLGMGEDGHVASLFPGDSFETHSTSRIIYRPVTATKPPPHRITLSYGMLEAARELWVLASGRGKEHALAESLLPNGHTPLAKVLTSRKRTVIFTDIKTETGQAI